MKKLSFGLSTHLVTISTTLATQSRTSNLWVPLLLASFLIGNSGCSLFFGNVKPTEERSTQYGVMDLSKGKSDWIKLDPKSSSDPADNEGLKETDAPTTGISDIAYQSKTTASI